MVKVGTSTGASRTVADMIAKYENQLDDSSAAQSPEIKVRDSYSKASQNSSPVTSAPNSGFTHPEPSVSQNSRNPLRPEPSTQTHQAPSIPVDLVVSVSPEITLMGEDPKLTTKGAAARLFASMGGLARPGHITQSAEIFRVLENRTVSEINLMSSSYEKLSGGMTLSTALEKSLGVKELRKAKLYLMGENSQADVRDATLLHMAMDGAGTDHKGVLDVLYGKSGTELKEIAHQYRTVAGRELETDIENEHSGKQKVYAQAVFKRGRIEPADSIKAAMSGWMTDGEMIKGTIQRLGDAGRLKELESLETDYKDYYGTALVDDLRENLGPRDYVEAKALLENGTLHPEDEIKLAIMGKGYLSFGVLGYGTDPKTVEAQFAGKTHEERQVIVERFNRKYGDLSDALYRNLSGGAFKDIQLVLDPANPDGKLSPAHEFHRTMRGLGADFTKAREVLEGLSDEERASLKTQYREIFKQDIEYAIEHEFWGQRGAKLKRVLERGKLSPADRIYYAAHGFRARSDGDEMIAALADATPEERATLAEDYQREWGEDLSRAMDGFTLSSSTKLEIQLRLKHGDLTPADKIRCALEGFGIHRRNIYNALDAATSDELKVIREDEALIAQIKTKAASWLGSNKPLERVLEHIENGGMPLHDKLYYAIDGLRTSEDYILSLLDGLDFEGRETLLDSYQAKRGSHLVDDLKSCMKRREFFKAEDLLMPKPQSIRERIDQLEYRVARERGSGSIRSQISDGIVDLFSHKGTILDHQVREFKRLPRLAYQAGGEMARSAIVPEMEVARHCVDKATEDYVEVKDDIANKVATVATLTAAATSVAATGGMSAPAALAVIAATTGATKVAGRMLVQGDSYNIVGYDGAYDLGTGAAGGAAMYAIGALGNELTAFVGKEVLAGEGVDVSAQGMMALGQQALGDAGATASQAAIDEAARGVVMAKGAEYMGQSFAHQFGTGIAFGAAKGMTYSAVTGVSATLLDDSLWERDLPSAIKKLLKEAADKAGGGAEGWSIGTAAWNIGAIAAESTLMQLRIGIGQNIAAKNGVSYSDNELLSAGKDILGSDAAGLSADAVRAAGQEKLINDLGADFLKNTVEGRVLASTVNNTVTRGVAAYPKALLNSLGDHDTWQYGMGAGLTSVGGDATEAGLNDAVARVGGDITGNEASDLGLEGARATAAKNIVWRGLSAAQ
ncbi:MAG: hypothetical protein HOK28_10865 [Deltaproteobacteria bacterium]|nr:hypothetical protein [Deltaproteobacteria bacterium]